MTSPFRGPSRSRPCMAARIMTHGWSRAAGTNPASTIHNGSTGTWSTAPAESFAGQSCAAPALGSFQVIAPARVNSLGTNVAPYDLGKNAPIIPRFKVTGPVSLLSIKITPPELGQTGDVPVDARFQQQRKDAYWLYTLAGGGRGVDF